MAAGAPERYRSLDALRDAAVYVDGQGHIQAGNDAFQELWILSGAGRGRFGGAAAGGGRGGATHERGRIN